MSQILYKPLRSTLFTSQHATILKTATPSRFYFRNTQQLATKTPLIKSSLTPLISSTNWLSKSAIPKQLQANIQGSPGFKNPFAGMIARWKVKSVVNNTSERLLRRLFEFRVLNHLNLKFLWKLHELAPFPLTLLIVLICNGIFALTFFIPEDDITQALSVIRYKVYSGEYYRLLTACLTHTFWLHLAFNSAIFITAARAIELRHGPLALGLVALATGLFSCASQIAFGEMSNETQITTEKPMVGISGIVMGLLGFGIIASKGKPQYSSSLSKMGQTHARRLFHVMYVPNFSVAFKIGVGALLFGQAVNYFLPSVVAQTAHVTGFLAGAFSGSAYLIGGMPGLALSAAYTAFISFKMCTYDTYRYNAWKAVQEFTSGNWANAEKVLRNMTEKEPEDKWAAALLALTLSQIPEKRQEAVELANSIDVNTDLATEQTLKALQQLYRESKLARQIAQLKSEVNRTKDNRKVFGRVFSPAPQLPPPGVKEEKQERLANLEEASKQMSEAIKEAKLHQPWVYLKGERVVELWKATFQTDGLLSHVVENSKELIRNEEPVKRKSDLIKEFQMARKM